MGARMCRQMVLHGYTSCMATCMSFISLVKMILLPSRQLYPKFQPRTSFSSNSSTVLNTVHISIQMLWSKAMCAAEAQAFADQLRCWYACMQAAA